MLLQDELKPYFNTIYAALEKKGDMPRAQEAQRALAQAWIQVTLVDAREQYLTDALTPKPGTILIFLEGNPHRPIRKRVLKTTARDVVVEWHEPKRLAHYFNHQGEQKDSMRDHQEEPDKLDLMELRVHLASACIAQE